MNVREYTREDREAALALRNTLFPPIAETDWDRVTAAAVAYEGERLVGVIPFNVREYVLGEGVTARLAIANSVGVAEDLQGGGIGTRMMAASKTFLSDHAEATIVYTGPEVGSPQYRFYRRTAYHDLFYPRKWRRPAGAPEGSERATHLDPADLSGVEPELVRLHAACFRGTAGYPPRVPGYWREALRSHIFVELPCSEYRLTLVGDGERPVAYAVSGLRDGATVVLEWAAPERGSAARLWSALADLTATWGATETILSAQETWPEWAGSLADAGFVRLPRQDVLVGHVLAPQALYERWTRGAPAPDVAIWTPEREVELGGGGSRVELEMAEPLYHRMLLGRLDLAHALASQFVTVRAGSEADLQQLAHIFRPQPWVHHELDYL
jgi:GNAT superfamily N-acetyltransferase